MSSREEKQEPLIQEAWKTHGLGRRASCLSDQLKEETMMFNVGDRVVIKSDHFPEFSGKVGTVVSNHLYHAYEEWRAFEVKLDWPFQPSFLKEVVQYYTAREEELTLTDILPPFPPKKKKKWWQWGT
jgi:hypothetical protein